MLYDPYGVAKANLIEYEDLLQYALTGLWSACLSHDSIKSSFQTHAINNIRWSIFDGLNRDCSLIKYDVNNLPLEEDMYLIESIDTPIKGDDGEDTNQHDTIPTDEESTEDTALNKILSKESLRSLSERDRTIIHMKSMGATDKEISVQFGITDRAINKAYNNIQRRMKRKEDVS